MNRSARPSSVGHSVTLGYSEIERWKFVKKFETRAISTAMIIFSFISFIVGLSCAGYGWEIDDPGLMTIGLISLAFSVLFLFAALYGIGAKIEVNDMSFTYTRLFRRKKEYDFRDIYNLSFMGRGVRVHAKGKLTVICPIDGQGYFLLKAKELGIIVYYVNQKVTINGLERTFVLGDHFSYGPIPIDLHDAFILIRRYYVHLHYKNEKGNMKKIGFRKGGISTEYLLLIAKEAGVDIRSY